MDLTERINLIKNSLNSILSEQKGLSPFPDLGGGRPNVGGGGAGGGGGGSSPVAPPGPPVSPPSPSPRPRPPSIPPRTPPNPPVPQPRPVPGPGPSPVPPGPRPVPGPGPSPTPQPIPRPAPPGPSPTPPGPRPVPGPGPSPTPSIPRVPQQTGPLPRTSPGLRTIGGALAAGYGAYKLWQTLKGKAAEEEKKNLEKGPKQFLQNPVAGLMTSDGSPIINTENPSQSGARERSRSIALRYASGSGGQ